MFDPVLVDIEAVKAKADAVGKTEATWNVYQIIVDYHETFIREGLTPVIMMNPLDGSLAVTSEEHINYKLH